MDVGGAVRRALTEHGGVPEEVLEYAADSAAGLVEDMGDEDVDTIAREMEDALGALLEGSMGEADVAALCKQVAAAFKGIDGPSVAGGDGGGDGGGSPAPPTREMLMKCDGIILAYAGKSLLRSTKLHLARGARYGIVGHNGVFRLPKIEHLPFSFPGCHCFLVVCEPRLKPQPLPGGQDDAPEPHRGARHFGVPGAHQRRVRAARDPRE